MRVSVLDLEEVGQFFSELISSKRLNLSALPVVGFQFLQMYFISQNLMEKKLSKIVAPEKKNTTSTGVIIYSSWNKSDDDFKDEELQDDDATFKINTEPSQLSNLDMVWTLALECDDEDVVPKAVAFLVNCYLSLADAIED